MGGQAVRRREAIELRPWRNLRAVLLAGGACLYAHGALAQEAATADPGPQIDEVVVTARKRAETVQDVPVTIGVVSPTAIASTGTASLSAAAWKWRRRRPPRSDAQ